MGWAHLAIAPEGVKPSGADNSERDKASAGAIGQVEGAGAKLSRQKRARQPEPRFLREALRRDRAKRRGARSRPSARKTKPYARLDSKPSSIPNTQCLRRAQEHSSRRQPAPEPLPLFSFGSPRSRLSRQYSIHTTTSMKGVTGLLPGVWRGGDSREALGLEVRG